MDLFEEFQPLEENEKKKRQLKKKISKKMKGKQPIPKVRTAIAAAAILLFIVGLGLSGDYLKPTIQGSHVKTNDQHVSQPSSKSKQFDVSVRHLTFKGESKHWKAVNKVFERDYFYDPSGKFVGNIFRIGYFRLVFKGDPAKYQNQSFQLKISGTSRVKSSSGGKFPVDGVVEDHEVFADTSTDQIKVTVKWGNHEEKLVLNSDRKAYREIKKSNVPRLSMVKTTKLNQFIGFTGSDAFQISSIGWNHYLGVRTVSAYLKVDGYTKSQMLNFILNADQESPVRIVGEHQGKRKLLYQQTADSPVIEKNNGTILLPAVVSFGRSGLWKIRAFSGENQIGSPIYLFVYQPLAPPNPYNGIERLKNDTVRSFGSTYTGDWSKENGKLIFHAGSEMTIHVFKAIYNSKQIKNPFPILVYGIPYSGGTPFVKVLTKKEVTVSDKQYRFQETFPFDKPGEWEIYIQEGQWPASWLRFIVK